MATALIIGAGGVGRVVTHKCVMNAATFDRIILASRTIKRCEEIQSELPAGAIEITTVDCLIKFFPYSFYNTFAYRIFTIHIKCFCSCFCFH